MDPSKRFVTYVLAAGVLVLLAAIAVGEHMGDRVLGRASERALSSVPVVTLTPQPQQSIGPYGPDWKRSQTLSAAGDPGFPDPRVPPKPLPTLPPTPKPTAKPVPKRTLNPNVPIWDQTPIPSGNPVSPVESPSPAASGSPSPGASVAPSPSAHEQTAGTGPTPKP